MNDQGLLCYGGDLSPERLLLAYRFGIFPWYNKNEPLLWWSLTPRMVLKPHEVRIAKSMRSYFNQRKYTVTCDRQFTEVMLQCRNAKRNHNGTWIHDEMIDAYEQLHQLGYAHSIEVYDDTYELVGGLYGVSVGNMFCGESMFAHKSNASKFGFIRLCQYLEFIGMQVIDCQQETPHLRSLGAYTIPQSIFLDFCKSNALQEDRNYNWSENFDRVMDEGVKYPV